MGPEFLLKARGLLFMKQNLILVTVGKADATGADHPWDFTLLLWAWVMELDLGSNRSPLASWLCGLGQMTQSL